MNTVMRSLLGSQQTGDELGGLIMRSLEETEGRWSVKAIRRPGFENIQRVLADPSVNFRALSPLPEKAQVVIDSAVTRVGLDRLSVVKTLLGAGLRYNLTDPLSVTQLEWYGRSKAANATRSMSPESRDENFLTDLLQARLPIYLTKATFFLDIRTLRMSQRVGMPLDTSNIEEGTRAVNESIEDAMINGAQTLDGVDLQVAGYKAPGLLNAPGAATGNLTASAWTGATPAPATVFQEVQTALNKLRANKRFGPYAMFTPINVSSALDADYGVSSPGVSIRDRLLKTEGLQSIQTADLLPQGDAQGNGAKVVIVQLTSDIVDVVVGQMPTVIPWTSISGFTFYNMVMAIMIPRVKVDYTGKTGIYVGTLGPTGGGLAVETGEPVPGQPDARQHPLVGTATTAESPVVPVAPAHEEHGNKKK